MAARKNADPGKAAAKTGRPRIEFDLEKVRELGEAGATYEEVADILDCSVRTIDARLQVDGPQYDRAFSRAFRGSRAASRLALRKKQRELANEGNDKLLIHLGKSELGQSDKVHHEVTGTLVLHYDDQDRDA